jgi:hypothetical protein
MAEFNYIRWAARELSPVRPIKFLSELARSPRSTAKAWYSGRRRAPISILQRLRNLAADRQLSDLAGQLAYYIQLREREPKHASGFMVVDPLTGRDKRNRWGRPKRSSEAVRPCTS